MQLRRMPILYLDAAKTVPRGDWILPKQNLVDRRLQPRERSVLLLCTRDGGECECDRRHNRDGAWHPGDEQQQQGEQREDGEGRRCPTRTGELERLARPDQRCMVSCHVLTVGPRRLNPRSSLGRAPQDSLKSESPRCSARRAGIRHRAP